MEHDKKSLKEKKLDEIYEKYKENLTSIEDLTAGDDPNLLFFLWVKLFGFMLDDNPDKTISERGVKNRKYASYLLRKIAPKIMLLPQVVEDRNELLGYKKYEDGKKITLPKEPVIWTLNHGFKDDGLSTVTANGRSSYFLFGSLPQFYNTFDGFAAWYNGSIIINRKMKNSRIASMEKAGKVLDYGGDVVIFPEGVWNFSPNRLLLDFWPGVYRLAQEKGVKVVPTIHYVKDKSEGDKRDAIHTVIDEPIDFSNMSEKEALEYLRDTMATWYYLMMEKYGKSTREEELFGYKDVTDAWEQMINDRLDTVDYYDFEYEATAAYQDKSIVTPEEVWGPIANIKNVTFDNLSHVVAAKKLIREYKKNDFQSKNYS